MKRAVLNYWVDMITGVAFLFCAVTGIVRLFPEATTLTAAGTPAILGVSSALWTTIHDWSGAIMAAGVGLHMALHLKWLTHMTRKMAGGSRRRRVVDAGPPRAQVTPLDAAPTESPVGTTRGADHPASAAAPQMVAAGSLERHERTDKVRPADQPSRMDRKAFLAGSAVLGAVTLLGGLSLVNRRSGSTTAPASESSPVTTDGDAGSSGSTSESSSSGDSTAGADTSSGTPHPARVVVDSGRCTGCGDCLRVCPRGVFSFDGSMAVAQSPDACTLCGRCLQVCRASAITLNG